MSTSSSDGSTLTNSVLRSRASSAPLQSGGAAGPLELGQQPARARRREQQVGRSSAEPDRPARERLVGDDLARVEVDDRLVHGADEASRQGSRAARRRVWPPRTGSRSSPRLIGNNPRTMRTDWPNDARAAISLTFDVDAETGWLGEDPAYAHRLSTLSEARFGITRGLPRILDTARPARHQGHVLRPRLHRRAPPDAIRRIARRRPRDRPPRPHAPARRTRSTPTPNAKRSSAASKRSRPSPPRSATAPRAGSSRRRRSQLLQEHGFTYDSSLMGDDRPYRSRTDSSSSPSTGASTTGRTCTGSRDEATRSRARRPSSTPGSRSSSQRSDDRRHLTYTMHPEVIGRGYRMQLLDDLITAIRERADVWFATHADVAASSRHDVPRPPLGRGHRAGPR